MLRRTLLSAALAAGWIFAEPAAAPLPTPESHFGHKIGQDRTVLDWSRVVDYFQALARSSNRIRVREYGRSTENRPLIAAFIAAPGTLRDLDRYQDIQARLADPRRTPQAEAVRLAAQGKAVVMITCSIHATEIASTHSAVEFAHRLLTSDDAKTRAILENTILILVPTLNPDGLDLVTRWYRRTLGTPHEGTSPPELYQKYTGHDNNRDWYFFTQAETRATVSGLHNVWHPQIVYDIHQQGPYASRMFVPPWIDPIEPNIDPILAQLCNMIGTGMAADLTAAGKTGVAINALYDFWTPARHYQAYHGGLRILSESASARIASPMTVQPGQIAVSAQGYQPRERSWNHLEPWLGGEWKLRDIIDYQIIAMESLLYQAATRREDLLRAFYHVGQRATGRTSPWGFAVPAAQFDPGSARRMLETLAFGQVEIERAAAPFQAGGRSYAAGDYVIRMQQPYSSFAKTLLERQRYPERAEYPGGPPRRPYDVTAHTLPLLMGVRVDTLEQAADLKLERAAQFAFTPAGPPEADVSRWRELNQAGGRPRLALYRSHIPNMDEGWTRWVLEQFGFRYESLGNGAIQASKLRDRFDVILFADQGANSIAAGYRPEAMPAEYTGGLGTKGAEALQQFAAEGGTLVFLNEASNYATEHLGIKLKNVLRGIPARDFYVPGSLLNARLDPASPITAGLPEELTIWFEDSPAWEIPADSPARVIARYPQAGLLASGWLLGEKHLAGKAALVEFPLGQGRAILFGMRPQYRGQSWQTFKLLFNAIGTPAAGAK